MVGVHGSKDGDGRIFHIVACIKSEILKQICTRKCSLFMSRCVTIHIVNIQSNRLNNEFSTSKKNSVCFLRKKYFSSKERGVYGNLIQESFTIRVSRVDNLQTHENAKH